MVDQNATCGNILIDYRNDFVRNISIAYNSSGVYGFLFETYLNKTYGVGQKVTSPTLAKQLWGLNIYEDKPQYTFVGFAGYHYPCALDIPQRISSL